MPATTLGTPSQILARTRCSSRSSSRAVFAAAARLVLVLRVLALVPRFLFLGQAFPVVLCLVGLFAPVLANDFGDVWIREAWVFVNYAGLVVLPVEDEGCWDGRSGQNRAFFVFACR